ncbi:EthD domain-containing protein [Hypoxylon rubiginosum]|uniref:EthD domain-containing protein n=1 Tax=Hypoxylon rubiginosum TaxID=110542 RepID=A0ACC0DA83_9PEZI|nr:EthD domain-containing protein [Hypoxylon rubiginosum]
MTFNILIVGHRLPGVSPTQFKQYYERHMSHIQEMAGAHFPVSHTRRYVQRSDGQNANVLLGSQANFDYDVLAEMVFEDEEAWKGFCEVLGQERNAKWIEEDEKNFYDRSRGGVVVLGEVEVTERKV